MWTSLCSATAGTRTKGHYCQLKEGDNREPFYRTNAACERPVPLVKWKVALRGNILHVCIKQIPPDGWQGASEPLSFHHSSVFGCLYSTTPQWAPKEGSNHRLEHINPKCNLFYVTLFRMQMFPWIIALSFKFSFCSALENIILCLTLKIQTQIQHFEFTAGWSRREGRNTSQGKLLVQT